MQWLKDLFNEKRSEASTKSVAFMFSVFGGLGWLSYGVIKYGITKEWVAAFTVLLAGGTVPKIVATCKADAPQKPNDDADGI